MNATTQAPMKANDLIVELAKHFIHPVLRDSGFTRRLLRWQRRVGDFVDVIDFQPSRWNERTDAEFTVNLGVLLPFVYETCWQSEVPKFPSDVDCTVRRRIGFLLTSGNRAKAKDRWWQLRAPSDLEVTGSQVLSCLTEVGLPFLDRVRSLEAVRNYLLEDKRLGQFTPSDEINLSIVLARLGDAASASKILSGVLQRHPAWQDRARGVAAKLQLSIPA